MVPDVREMEGGMSQRLVFAMRRRVAIVLVVGWALAACQTAPAQAPAAGAASATATEILWAG